MIKMDYSKVIDYTKKANKEVFANAYYVPLTKDYMLNFQLYGKKVPLESAEEKAIKPKANKKMEM